MGGIAGYFRGIMAEQNILGIHHITAITADPKKNIDFHTGILGLRLAKMTVNYDDPGSYHLYFGDGIGRPGTILTFFVWPQMYAGRHGAGQATALSFSIPERSEGFWLERLRKNKVIVERPYQRFDEEVITFYNPDGLKLELVAHRGAGEKAAWLEGPISEEYAIRGFYGISLSELQGGPTAAMLTETLGFRPKQEVGERARFECGRGGSGTFLDMLSVPGGPGGLVATGTIHHIAWRTPNDREQESWRAVLAQQDFNVTGIIDRYYFHSIYFREPGGALFEIATDSPGFTIDEPPGRLGTELKLPPWMESNREAIKRRLPPLDLKKVGQMT
jgi:glyoxalase family protein